MYIWQAKNWSSFSYDETRLTTKLEKVKAAHILLLGDTKNLPDADDKAAQMNALIQNAIRTSAIEGEHLDVGSVRSSVAKHLGLETAGIPPATKQTNGLVSLLMDAINSYPSPLSIEKLCQWQGLLFPEPPLIGRLRIAELRGEEPMQVVSQNGTKQIVHFEAPPKAVLTNELEQFLNWFNHSNEVPPFLKAGIAHLWFITLHPFDDSNGRLARVITDKALAQGDHTSIRFYAISAAIEAKRSEYYTLLEAVQNNQSTAQLKTGNPSDITDWLSWFLDILLQSIHQGRYRIARTLAKSTFWYRHSQTVLSERQIKVLNRLLDNFGEQFTQGINAAKYQSLAKVSKATATRDLVDLLNKACLVKTKSGGRSTRYFPNIDVEVL